MGKNAKLKERQKWFQNSIMQENYEEFISSTRRTRNLRKPSRMLAGNWKHQWLPLCLAREARTIRIGRLIVNPLRSNQKLACMLEASECTRLRMGESLPNHHEDRTICAKMIIEMRGADLIVFRKN